MRSFTFGNRRITQDSKPFVIAEIGNNAFVMDDDEKQSRSLKVCKILFDRAKANGADAVKLQKRDVKGLFTDKLYNMPYINDNSYGKTYGEHREKLEFTAENWEILTEYAKKIDIPLFSTAFDLESVKFLSQFNFPAWKVASGCLKDTDLIKAMARTGKPMIISTGGGSFADIDRAFVTAIVYAPVCLLHCIASYPNSADNMNLAVVNKMLERYPETIIGLSDHYPGNLMAEIAYILGARVFEKHFTGNKAWPGPDHALSMDPDDLHNLVHDFEKIRASVGTGEKFMLPCEEKGIYKMGKSIYAVESIRPGHVITEKDVVVKSPAEGLEPYHHDEIIGKKTKQLIFREEPLKADMFENYST